MRTPLCLILLAAGCNFPDLAKAPETPSGPPPQLSPLGPLVTGGAEPDPEADTALEARAAALRSRAAALPADPIEPETRAKMENVRSN
jgi:hypothetical protein